MCKRFTTLSTNIDNNMINKIDIQKAASSKHNPAFGVSGYFAARTAFAAGVEWFKKALWHDVSEMPEEGEQILYTATEGGEIVDVMKVTTIALYDFTPWDKVVSNYGITKWCYIEDLLPKGGEK